MPARPAPAPLDGGALAAVRADVDRHYSGLLRRFGPTPLGVGWTCVPTQELRFIQLTRPLGASGHFSINDIGCGYGALLGFLRKRLKRASIDYLGLDISQAMIDEARRRWAGVANARFEVSEGACPSADFCVASGVFNVKLGHDRSTWEAFVAGTLRQMYAGSRIGTAVNFLREDDRLEEIPELYRCQPGPWVEYGRRLGAAVELRDGYGMPEFTLLLRRH